MRILIYLSCLVGERLSSDVKAHVSLYIDPSSEGFSDEEEFVSLCSSVSCPGGRRLSNQDSDPTTATATVASYVEPMLGRAELRSCEWTGDGIERQYEHWTEELVIISSLLQHGQQTPQFVLSEIKKRIPESEWTIEGVASRIRLIVSVFVVPFWLHELVGRCFRQGVVSIKRSIFADELISKSSWLPTGRGAPNVALQIAQDWLDFCYRYQTGAYLRCMEVVISRDEKADHVWALTKPQIALYLKTLEQRAILAAEYVPMKYESHSRKKQRKVGRSVRYHVLQRLIETPNNSDEMNVGIVNDAIRSSGSVSLSEYVAIKDEILRPTKQSMAFHHSMLAQTESLGRDEAVWFKYCIEPLRAHEDNKYRPRPCFFEDGHYRLSRKALIRYLKAELRLEANTL